MVEELTTFMSELAVSTLVLNDVLFTFLSHWLPRGQLSWRLREVAELVWGITTRELLVLIIALALGSECRVEGTARLASWRSTRVLSRAAVHGRAVTLRRGTAERRAVVESFLLATVLLARRFESHIFGSHKEDMRISFLQFLDDFLAMFELH